jgi:hypothetical protein
MTHEDDKLALTLHAEMRLEIQVDHEHEEGRLVPMIEQRDRSQLPGASRGAPEGSDVTHASGDPTTIARLLPLP